MDGQIIQQITKQIDRWIDYQIIIQIDWQIDRWKDRRQMNDRRYVNIQIDRLQIYKYVDVQINYRFINRWIVK